MRVNYMMSTWSGPRFKRTTVRSFVESHIGQLNRVKHNLSQVTIGHPYNPDANEKYLDYLFSLKSLNDGTPIVVCPMKNCGLSYGQWSRMFDMYRNEMKFSHYIFMEDDYVPILGNFDSIMVSKFDNLHFTNNCGYMCGLAVKTGDQFGLKDPCAEDHLAVSNGISSRQVMQHVWDENNGLYDPNLKDAEHQVDFSQRFVRAGYQLGDYIDEYRCLYYQHKEKFRMFGTGEDLIVPLQYLEEGKDWPSDEYIRKEGKMVSKSNRRPISKGRPQSAMVQRLSAAQRKRGRYTKPVTRR